MTRMGYEGRVFIGVAGSTATSLFTSCRDITEDVQPSKGKTTKRGAGLVPPIETEKVATRAYTLEITALNDTNDALVQQIKAAANAGTPIAILTQDFNGGTGYDGDMTFGRSSPWPLDGEQVVTFSGTPYGELRDPIISP